jgi:CRP-like cAMP-binding protein
MKGNREDNLHNFLVETGAVNHQEDLDLVGLIEKTEIRQYPKNSKIFGRDLKATGGIFVVTKGLMAMVGGENTFFDFLFPGDFFGQDIFPIELVNADYVALKDCKLAFISCELIETFLSDKFNFVKARNACLADLLSKSLTLLQLEKLKAEEKVAKFMDVFPSAKQAKLNLTMIAFACNLSRETVGRMSKKTKDKILK